MLSREQLAAEAREELEKVNKLGIENLSNDEIKQLGKNLDDAGEKLIEAIENEKATPTDEESKLIEDLVSTRNLLLSNILLLTFDFENRLSSNVYNLQESRKVVQTLVPQELDQKFDGKLDNELRNIKAETKSKKSPFSIFKFKKDEKKPEKVEHKKDSKKENNNPKKG